MDAEEDHEQEGEPEGRDGEADKHKDAGDPIEERVLADGGDHPEGDGDDENQQHGKDIQEDRDRQPLQDLVRDRSPVRGEGDPHIQDGQFSHPLEILLMEGFIQIVHRPEPFFHLQGGAGVHLGLEIGGGTGRQVHHGKTDDRDPEEERDHEKQSLSDVAEHGFLLVPSGQKSSISFIARMFSSIRRRLASECDSIVRIGLRFFCRTSARSSRKGKFPSPTGRC